MTQGKGIETLGSILATVGWSVAFIAAGYLLLNLGHLLRDTDGALVMVVLLGWVVGGLALAGLGHVLRALAQLGRNVHKLGAMLAARPPN